MPISALKKAIVPATACVPAAGTAEAASGEGCRAILLGVTEGELPDERVTEGVDESDASGSGDSKGDGEGNVADVAGLGVKLELGEDEGDEAETQVPAAALQTKAAEQEQAVWLLAVELRLNAASLVEAASAAHDEQGAEPVALKKPAPHERLWL